MTDETKGYHLGPEARVVAHRRGRGQYAVAVVLDEGPFTKDDALRELDRYRETVGGWVSKARAAEMLGVSQKQVDHLRETGELTWARDCTDRVMIDLASVNEYLGVDSAGNAK